MVREIDFRYKVTRAGADYCELFPASGGAPQIQMQDTEGVQTVFSGSFLPPAVEVDWLTDEIRPEMIINGVRSKLGVFLPYSVHEADTGEEKSITITANDRCWLVRDHRAERTVYFQAGTNYVEAVVSLLAEAGVTMISETATEAVFPEDREDWAVGTSYLDIVNGLLSEISYAPLWFDVDGSAIIEPAAAPTAYNIKHTLDETKIESLMLPGIQNSTNLLQTPNVFVCVCSNADKSGAMRAVAENTNPQSPLSIARRGRRITQVTQVDNIPSQEALQAYANRQVTESLLRGDVITVSTCLLPGFGVGDVTAIRYGGLLAICREPAWTMTLTAGGRMTHTLERAVLNLG